MKLPSNLSATGRLPTVALKIPRSLGETGCAAFSSPAPFRAHLHAAFKPTSTNLLNGLSKKQQSESKTFALMEAFRRLKEFC